MTPPPSTGSVDRYRARVAPVVDHVREHPAGDHRVEDLARLVHFSPYHFHRIFTAVTGETVGTYVRRVRLERAAQIIRASPERDLGRVALEVGFGSPSAFSRAFRKHYGTTPSAWDRRSPLTFRPADDTPGEAEPGPDGPDLAVLLGAEDPDPVHAGVEVVPGRTVAFHRVRMPFLPGRLQQGYDHLRRWLDERGLPQEPGGLWGMSWDDVEITPPEHIRYDFACQVPPGTPAAGDVRVRGLPELRIVAANARGDLGRVARVWDHLYHVWLPSSAYEPEHLPAFERYRAWPDRLDIDAWDLDCCIPLRAWGGG